MSIKKEFVMYHVFMYKYIWYCFYVLFVAYLYWDWNKFKAQKWDNKERVVFGFKKAMFAWILKHVMTYCICFSAITYIHHYLYHYTNVNHYLKNHEFRYPSVVTFNYGEVGLKVDYSLPDNELIFDESGKVKAFINKGSILVKNIPTFSINVLHTLFRSIVVFLILVFLWKIFNHLALCKPFTTSNVKRLRILALLILLYNIVDGLFYSLSHWYFHTHFFLGMFQNFRIRDVDYGAYFLCAVVFLLAEVIQSAVVLKDEQDLTV